MASKSNEVQSEYSKLPQVDDLEDSSRYNTKARRNIPERKLPTNQTLIFSHLLILGIYITVTILLLRREPSDAACTYKHSTPSPALPQISYQRPKHLPAEIVQKNKYRGPPSPEIDAEWLKIGLGTQAIRLYDEDLKKLNKSDTPDRPLHRIPEEYGGGYIGMLEVFHLLHCLNNWRKVLYKDYYIQEWKDAGDSAKMAHDEHCIDMLREYIMCTADVTPITFYDKVLQPERKLPMPDFNTLHTCRNFEDILEWNGNNERTIQWDGIGLDLGGKGSIA